MRSSAHAFEYFLEGLAPAGITAQVVWDGAVCCQSESPRKTQCGCSGPCGLPQWMAYHRTEELVLLKLTRLTS